MAVDWHIRTSRQEGTDDRAVCSVCGRTVDVNDVEDTSGWRWYSDGRGGLRPLCKSCPVPEDAEFPSEEQSARPPRDH
jgi:hypothetical protein